MSPSFGDDNRPYFFNQRRERSFARRLRKTPDDVSIRWEAGLGAADGGESVVSFGRLSRRPGTAAARRGSATGSRRPPIVSRGTLLPPVDKDGPRLVSGSDSDAKHTTRGSLDVEDGEEEEEEEAKEGRSGWTRVKEIYKFNELKFGSTSILSNLGRCLDSVIGEGGGEADQRETAVSQISDRIDTELVRKFLRDHRSLVSDIVVEKREWQTDCYLDLSSPKNRSSFLTPHTTKEGNREEEKEEEKGEEKEEDRERRRQAEEASIAAISQRYSRRLYPKPVTFTDVCKDREREKTRSKKQKRVTLNQEVMQKPDTPRRPQTAHSVLSNFSFHSDLSRPSSTDRESRFDHYDVLPAELRPPSIMMYKRESLVPQVKTTHGPRTRLEKYRGQTTPTRRKPTLSKSKSVKISPETIKESSPPKPIHRTGVRRPSTAIGGLSPSPLPLNKGPEIIKISLTDTDIHDRGWVVHAEETRDPEMATLRIWDRKSKERLRKREEEKMLARQRNADGPLVVKFYSNPQIRSLHSKHQRSATFPLPAILNKLPPSVANFSTPGVPGGDVMMIGEGPELAVLVMPDGSSHAHYHSRCGRRQAICQSRTNQDTTGLYTVVYDDTETNSVLGCFTPLGRGWCYYPGPASNLHLFYDTSELRLYNEDGHVTRRSVWASDRTTVSIQLNPCLSFHCTGLNNMVLRFSCRGQTYKFNVGLKVGEDAASPSPEKVNGDGATVLLSGLEFISDAAHARTLPSSNSSPPPSTKTKKPAKTLKKTPSKSEGLTGGGGGRGGKRDRSVSLAEDMEVEELARQTELLNLERTLTHYRDRVKMTVDEWMNHYRQVMGISIPAHLRTSLSRSTPPSTPRLRHHLTSSSSQRIRSSQSYTGEVVHSRPVSQQSAVRYHTHPITSRVTSPLGGQRSPRDPTEVERDDDPGSVRPMTTPPTTTPTPPSISGYERRREGQSPGRKKVRGRSSSVPEKSRGCPVALHNLLHRNLASLSPCKCDKRRPPFICDLEYDTFLTSHVPNSQVIVICILSSLVERSCPCEPMLDALHYSTNRQRFTPCTQSMTDQFRILKYDVEHSLNGTTSRSTTPLLVERHGVWPGLFLMYVGGRLIYADSVFNGYGTTKRDFLKQVERCSQEASRGHFIPQDYHFTSASGGKHPSSTSWAYPLSGVLGYLVPYSPSVSSLRSSDRLSVLLGRDEDDDKEESPLQLSKHSEVLQSGLNLSHSETIS